MTDSRNQFRRLFVACVTGQTLLALLLGYLSTSQHLRAWHDAHGRWVWAADAYLYRQGALEMAAILRNDGWRMWLHQPVFLHIKLFSLIYHYVNPSVIAGIPVYTVCYSCTLYLIYRIAANLFGAPEGLVAMCLAGLLPTFLLQSTQPLRDSFSIPAGLVIVLGISTLFGTTQDDNRFILSRSAVICLAYVVIVLFKPSIRHLYVLTFAVGTAYLMFHYPIHNQRFFVKVGAAGAILLCMGLCETSWWVQRLHLGSRAQPLSLTELSVSESLEDGEARLAPSKRPRVSAAWYDLAPQIARQRYSFRTGYPKAASNIDVDIAFQGWGDIVSYIPRALQIGFLAPFPTMWFEKGSQHTGRLGRLLSGLEMTFMYFAVCLAVRRIYRDRRPPVLFIAGFVLAGILLLALVITNVGALYRFRYVFWFGILILASADLTHILTPARMQSHD
jgi:hypothetical protein